MSYRPGDLVLYKPNYGKDAVSDELVDMIGIVLGDALFSEDEYLSVFWADGQTIDTHLHDLVPLGVRHRRTVIRSRRGGING